MNDEAGMNWQLKRPEVMLLARDVLGESDFQTLRTVLETRMAKKRVLPLQQCLERACAQTSTNGGSAAVLSECHLGQLVAECRVCSEAVVDAVYDLPFVSNLDSSDPRVIKTRELTRQRIEQACP
jgi:hypothetical protein